MKKFLIATASLTAAMFLALVSTALVLGIFANVVSALRPSLPCALGTTPVWSRHQHPDIPTLEFDALACRDDEGLAMGPTLSWFGDTLYSVSFSENGERRGTMVTFAGTRIWMVQDETADLPHSRQWSDSGAVVYESVRRGDTNFFTMRYDDGTLKYVGQSKEDWNTPTHNEDWTMNLDRFHSEVFVGEFRSFHENGNLKDSGSYAEGLRAGEWLCADSSGDHQVRAVFDGGRLISRSGDTHIEELTNRCVESPCGSASGPADVQAAGSGAALSANANDQMDTASSPMPCSTSPVRSSNT